jgi:hypothetical protein
LTILLAALPLRVISVEGSNTLRSFPSAHVLPPKMRSRRYFGEEDVDLTVITGASGIPATRFEKDDSQQFSSVRDPTL